MERKLVDWLEELSEEALKFDHKDAYQYLQQATGFSNSSIEGWVEVLARCYPTSILARTKRLDEQASRG